MAGIMGKIGDALHIGGDKKVDEHKEGGHYGTGTHDEHKKVDEHKEGGHYGTGSHDEHKKEGEHKEGGFMDKIKGKVGGEHKGEDGEKKKKKKEKKKHDDGHESSSSSDSD